MKRFGMVVLMGLTLTACNKTPDSFTIGSVDGVNLNEVQDGPTIRSEANYTWKLKVGQQIEFNTPYTYSTMEVADLSNQNICSKWDCKPGSILYRGPEDYEGKVEINESGNVITGKYVGEARVCVSRFDTKSKEITHSFCSTFEVVQ